MREKIVYGLDAHLASILEERFRECDWDWLEFSKWIKNVDFEQRQP